MLGMFAEIPLILVVYTEMKQTEKYFVIKIIQAASKLPMQRKITCIHANIEGFLDFNTSVLLKVSIVKIENRNSVMNIKDYSL